MNAERARFNEYSKRRLCREQRRLVVICKRPTKYTGRIVNKGLVVAQTTSPLDR